MLLEKVEKTIKKYNMLKKDDRVLVALSGGCDSVCLLLALKKLGYDVSAVHVNHNLRQEAVDDENFVLGLCMEIKIPCHVGSFNVEKTADEEKISLESAGRKIRYEFFNKTALENGYDKIAVAHNENDNCETFLLNLIRGTGLNGLTGIPPVRGNIVRPLIEVKREEIEEFVKTQGCNFVTDKTNFENDYTRNKIRNIIIPQLLKINGSFTENVLKTSQVLSVDNSFIGENAEKIVEQKSQEGRIKKSDLENVAPSVASRALMLAYEYAAGTNKDFENKHISYILENASKNQGKIIDLCFNVECVSEYGFIIFRKKKNYDNYEYKIRLNDRMYIDEGNLYVETKVLDVPFKKEKDWYYFDCDKLTFPLTVRNRREKDEIVPFGMKNRKKIKDVMINRKISVSLRKRLPLIISGNDVLAVLQVVRTDLYRVDKNTQKILAVKGEMCDAQR